MVNSDNGSDERKFLHDIATPLGSAILLVDMVSGRLQEKINDQINQLDDILQMNQAAEQLDRIKKMLQERRETLIKRGVPSSKPDKKYA